LARIVWVAVAAFAAALACARSAAAAPEEIQVYIDDMSEPGQFGLDLHNNYVLTGRTIPDYAGEETPAHAYRLTPEFAYGITPNLEAGLYILSTWDEHGAYRIDGEKVRLKFIAPKKPGQDWFWGLNFEIGEVQHHLDINPWNAELKGIYGVHAGKWLVAGNTNLDWAVSGPQKGPATIEQDEKVSYQVRKTLALGFETYNELGPAAHLGGDLSRFSQVFYLTADTSLRDWDLNLGVGRGFTGASDGWVLKAIIGVPIDPRPR
jgi:hypothetical protein